MTELSTARLRRLPGFKYQLQKSFFCRKRVIKQSQNIIVQIMETTIGMVSGLAKFGERKYKLLFDIFR